jgi:hypothetical protein
MARILAVGDREGAAGIGERAHLLLRREFPGGPYSITQRWLAQFKLLSDCEYIGAK